MIHWFRRLGEEMKIKEKKIEKPFFTTKRLGNAPVATFTFKYRSLGMLQNLCFVLEILLTSA